MSDPLSHKVLFVGWDAADWKLIHPLVEQGHMPTLKRVMDQGAWGNLATLQPVFSPMLWTSIATGKRADKHGIHGFTEPMPDGKGIRVSTSTTRKCKAIWNILSQEDFDVHTVSWFCSHPAEPIRGVCVSNMFEQVDRQQHRPDDWKLPEGTVHPAELTETLAGLRIHPSDLAAKDLLPFIPDAHKIDQESDPRLSMLAKLLCETVNVQSAATWIMENRPWDFMGIYFTAIDHFSHGFMQYHPPHMRGVGEDEFEIYKDVIVGCYRFHDMMLARQLQLAGDDATVIVCSDHGFHSDHLRPKITPQEPAGPAIWHRDYGMIAMKGPGIRPGEQIYGANLLDVTPTILTLLGLPVGDDMDGKPLVQALDIPLEQSEIARIGSWENVDGAAGMHPSDRQEDPFEARTAIRRLVDLGYIDPPDDNAEVAAAKADREAKFNLSLVYLDSGKVDQASEILTKLYEQHPDQARFGLNLTRCHLARRRFDEARKVANAVLDDLALHARNTIKRLDHLQEKVHQRAAAMDDATNPSSDTAAKHSSTSDEASTKETDAGGDLAEMELTPEQVQQADLRIATLRHQYSVEDVRATPQAKLLLGVVELEERCIDQAMTYLREAEQIEPQLPGLHLQIGRAYLRMRRWDRALGTFQRALDVDGDSALAFDGMAVAWLHLRQAEKAIDCALNAVGLMHYLADAHLHLGIALARLQMFERAVEAFQTCSQIAPQLIGPRRWLRAIYRSRLNQPGLADQESAQISEIVAQK